jgi:DNA repair exonuclease SbcCD ATPase subunit
MILRSITVKNFRCFLGEVSVGPFNEGLNVLHAPNATGKSTLFDAMTRCLIDSHKVSGQRAETLRPRGRSLAPKVLVEFVNEGTAYRFSKRFLDKATCELEREENGHYEPYMENEAADDYVRGMLTKNPPQKGLSDARHWGLSQILWAPQDGIVLSAISDPTVRDIKELLGAHVSTAGSDRIESRIEAMYSEIFTPGGTLKKGKQAPPVTGLEEELHRFIEEHEKAKELRLHYEDASRGVADLKAGRQQREREASKVSEDLEDASARQRDYAALQTSRKELLQQVDAVKARHTHAAQLVSDIVRLRKELDNTTQRITSIRTELPVLEREEISLGRDTAEKQGQLDAAKVEREQVERAQDLADAARNLSKHGENESHLRERLEAVAEVAEALGAESLIRKEIVAPDKKTLGKIRMADKKLHEIETELRAALITLEIVPESDGELEVVTGDTPGKTPIVTGEALTLHGSPEVSIRWPGAGTVRASGPSGSVDELRKKLKQKERKLAELTEGYGTRDPEELEALYEKAKKLDDKIDRLMGRNEDLLGGDDLVDLERDLSLARAALEEILEHNSGWRDKSPDPDDLSKHARELRKENNTSVGDATAAWQVAHKAHASAKEKLSTARTRLEEADRTQRRLERDLTNLVSDGLTNEQRIEQRNVLALDLERAGSALDEIERRLSSWPEDPASEVEKLEKQLTGYETEAKETSDKLIRAEERLQSLVDQSPHTTLSHIEERIDILERRIAAQKLRNEAVRLLHDTVETLRADSLSAITGPVSDSATLTLHRIAGSRIGEMRMDEGLLPSALASTADALPVDVLSGGEREQVYLAVRLALADVIARNERQLLVLDDVLTSTDSARHARIITILEEAAQRLQVLILTCHSERYLALEGAHFIDLEEIVRKE